MLKIPKINCKYVYILTLILCILMLINNRETELFRNFYKPNPELRSNMSYDLRGDLDVNDKKKVGIFYNSP